MGNGQGEQNRSATPMPATLRIGYRTERYHPPVREQSALICCVDAEIVTLAVRTGRNFVRVDRRKVDRPAHADVTVAEVCRE